MTFRTVNVSYLTVYLTHSSLPHHFFCLKLHSSACLIHIFVLIDRRLTHQQMHKYFLALLDLFEHHKMAPNSSQIWNFQILHHFFVLVRTGSNRFVFFWFKIIIWARFFGPIKREHLEPGPDWVIGR